MEYKDYYKILGISKGASEKEIKSAYRKLARKYHPDVNPGDKSAETRFKEINEAHAVLADPEKRKRYDTLGPDWEKRFQQGYRPGGQYTYTSGGAGQSAGDFSDFFESLFGQRAGAGEAQPFEFDLGSIFTRGRGRNVQQQQRGADVEQPITISLREALDGVTREFTVQTAEGKTKRLEVKVPPGVKEGSRIRVAGEGNPGTVGGPSGDLYFVVRMVPDSRFRREGDDLHSEAGVPLTTLILGGEVEVPTVNGAVTVTVPADSQNGRRLRLAGQGLPQLKGSNRGDLYVKLNALLPTSLDEKQRDLFKQLAQAGV